MANAVIFDLDGLLIDSEIYSYKIYKEILHEFGYEFSKEEFAENISGKTIITNITNLITKYNLRGLLNRDYAGYWKWNIDIIFKM